MYGFETTNVTQGGAQVYTTYLLTNHVPVMLGGGGYALNDSKSPYTRARRRVPPFPSQWLAGSSRWGSRDSGSTGWKRSSSKPCAVGVILMTVFSGMETSTHSSRRSPEK